MSAYVIGRNHIEYLVNAAMPPALDCLGSAGYYHGTERHVIRDESTRIGQMLWDENIKSVLHRYTREAMPGPINEDSQYTHKPNTFWQMPVEPVQVIKACHCYRYQACEHPEYYESEAEAFISWLIDKACMALPGYDDAKWGAPDMFTQKVASLTGLEVVQ